MNMRSAFALMTLCAALAPAASAVEKASLEALRLAKEVGATHWWRPYATTFDLGRLDETLAALDAAAMAEKDARTLADLRFYRELLLFRAARDDDPAGHLAAMRAVAFDKATPPAHRFTVLLRYSQWDPEFDYWKVACGMLADDAALAADSDALSSLYFNAFESLDRKGLQYNWSWALDPRTSNERWLEIAERGIADAVAGRLKDPRTVNILFELKLEALFELERNAEAESFIAESTKEGAAFRLPALRAAGAYWRKRAERFYAAPDRADLAKAYAAYAALNAASPKPDREMLVEQARTALARGDWSAARADFARAIAAKAVVSGGELGDVEFEAGDYEKAVSFYATDARLGVKPLKRYAQALAALGRHEECLAQLEVLEKKANRHDSKAVRAYIAAEKRRVGR